MFQGKRPVDADPEILKRSPCYSFVMFVSILHEINNISQ